MNKWSVRALFNEHLIDADGLRRMASVLRPFSALGAMLLVPFLLTGCAKTGTGNPVSHAVQAIIPDSKVVDYQTASCETLWFNDDKEAVENGLYWLRAMDCADRLSGQEARLQARSLGSENWQRVFKQSVLVGSAEPTAAERRQIIDRLNGYRSEFPASVRPLLQLWREKQMLMINILDEKARYQKLQASTDSQLDALRETQGRLQYQLDDTTRKLENLTDIERQLSSRKQMSGEMSDPSVKEDSSDDTGKSESKAPAEASGKPASEPANTDAH